MKKVIISIIVVLVIVVSIVTGIYFYSKKNAKEVSVYNIRDVGMTDFWQDSNQTEGTVKEDKTQSVYLSDTQQVDKILVKEGDKVKKGTALLKYSTTLTSLELERKQIDIRKKELELENQKKELEKIKNYQPNVPIYGNPQTSTPQVQEPVEPTVNYIQLTPPVPAVSSTDETIPAPITGSGTNEAPYMYLWSEGKEYDKTFIEKLIARAGVGSTEVYAIFMIRENNEVYGNFKSASKIKFTKKVDDYTFSIVKNYSQDEDPIIIPNQTPAVPETPIVPEVIEEVGPSYSAEELKKMVLEKEKEISEIILDIKVAKSEYNTLEKELKDTTVYSKIDGVVKTVLSLDNSEIKTKPVIVVSGGGGYYITGYVGELSLDEIKVGQKVTAMSYNTGSMAEGEVKEVSNIPVLGYTRFGMGNNNVSYYPYTVFVGEEGAFKEGDYVQLTPQVDASQQSALYLMKAFIIEENGKYFVYVANGDNKLEKRQISVNGGVYEYLKIQSGLSENDKVAFPYGKNIKEGATTVDGTLDELYY